MVDFTDAIGERELDERYLRRQVIATLCLTQALNVQENKPLGRQV